MSDSLLSTLTGALVRAPEDAALRLRLAELLMEMGRPDEALPHIGAAIVDAPASIRPSALLRAHPDFPKWVRLTTEVRGGSNAAARKILGLPPNEPVKTSQMGKQVYTKNGVRIETISKLLRRAAKSGERKPVRLTVTLSGTDVEGGPVVVPVGHELFEPIVEYIAKRNGLLRR